MAIIKVLFKVDGVEAEVIHMSYSFDQNVDHIGQPAGEVRGGVINVTVGSTKEKNFGWMVASDVKKNGELEFIDSTGATLKTLKFEDGYCVGYTEEFEAFNANTSGTVSIKDAGKETLTLSCRKISVEGESHENTWV